VAGPPTTTTSKSRAKSGDRTGEFEEVASEHGIVIAREEVICILDTLPMINTCFFGCVESCCSLNT